MDLRDCWICGNIADSEEHKFKASDLKRAMGKKFDGYYIRGEIIKISSYKDKRLKFPKVICTECNNNLTRPHDNAYDKFVKFCFLNHEKLLEIPVIDYQEIYGVNWMEEKANLYRYYVKHAGCKIVTTGLQTDLTNLAECIKGNSNITSFILAFEMKDGVKALMNAFNRDNKYTHLYNSETCTWDGKFGGWLTNNYMTVNWVFGKELINGDSQMIKNRYDFVIKTDTDFFDIELEDSNDTEFSRMKFINKYMVGFENGYNKTFGQKKFFFEALILLVNKVHG